MYFESHAHYDDNRYNEDRDALLQALPQAGIDVVINIGANMASSKRSIQLAEQYGYMYAAVGVHPHDAKDMTAQDLTTLKDWCRHEKVVAVGEIGLDFYYNHSPKDTQQYWFEKQMELAGEVGLPIVIHSRDAAEKVYRLVEKSGLNRGVVHCYSGSAEMAMDYVNLGFHIGVGGVVTFPNAKNLVKAVERVPASRILLETDCPYLAPVPHRGERNSSQYLEIICHKIAQIKQVTKEEMAQITMQNGLELFRIENNC